MTASRTAAIAATLLLGSAGSATAATVGVPPTGNSWNYATANTFDMADAWNGLAESVMAVDSHVTFGFYLFGASQQTMLYSLYAGDGDFSAPLKQVTVTSPIGTPATSTLVTADFSDVTLTPGQSYTFEVSMPDFSYPDDGGHSIAAVSFAGENNPYPGGHFYYAGRTFSDATIFANRDLAFQMTGVPGTPAVPEPASWALMVGGFGLVGGALRSGPRRAETA